jgi:hypothetical protein
LSSNIAAFLMQCFACAFAYAFSCCEVAGW